MNDKKMEVSVLTDDEAFAAGFNAVAYRNAAPYVRDYVERRVAQARRESLRFKPVFRRARRDPENCRIQATCGHGDGTEYECITPSESLDAHAPHLWEEAVEV